VAASIGVDSDTVLGVLAELVTIGWVLCGPAGWELTGAGHSHTTRAVRAPRRRPRLGLGGLAGGSTAFAFPAVLEGQHGDFLVQRPGAGAGDSGKGQWVSCGELAGPVPADAEQLADVGEAELSAALTTLRYNWRSSPAAESSLAVC
jgi:hypothetical protein